MSATALTAREKHIQCHWVALLHDLNRLSSRPISSQVINTSMHTGDGIVAVGGSGRGLGFSSSKSKVRDAESEQESKIIENHLVEAS